MGTSKSNPGAGDRSPLIPDWADDGGPPPPPPDPKRFKAFRTSLGRAARSRSTSDLAKALANYARHSTGGSTTASRRFSTVAKDGSQLIRTLSALQSGGPVEVNGKTLPDLAGMPCDVAIDILITELSGGHGDSEKVRTAMQEALANALDGQDQFDPNQITDDVLVDVLLNYLSDCVFLDIMANGADALSKAEDGEAAIAFENMLRETVEAAVDAALKPLLDGNSSITTLSLPVLTQVQQQAIRDVWDAWQGEEE